METRIDENQLTTLREDISYLQASLRRWFRWLVTWVFLIFLITLLQYLGIRP